MKICLIGQYLGNLDEGMKNISYHLLQELSKHHETMTLSPKKALLPTSIINIRKFHPQIIHYIHGPTIRSFAITKYLSKIHKGCKTVISATHPVIFGLQRNFVPMLKPDLILVQSHDTEKFFKALGCKTKFVPMSGVDLKRFKPATNPEKVLLRNKYKLKENEFIILHIGSISKSRNLQLFGKIQKDVNGQVLIVGSTSAKTDKGLFHFLRKSGCTVWLKYFPNIEELFKLSDVYVFPTIAPYGSIELPLTLLEAMACNLPVITTRFGAFPRLFSEKNGVFYYTLDEGLRAKINLLKQGFKVMTRERVLNYSWDKIALEIEREYQLLI